MPFWEEHFQPIEVEENENSLRLIYEGKLTKQGASNIGCNQDYQWNKTRSVYLRVL